METNFVKVNKELIKEDVKVGDIFGLEVIEVGEQITFNLKKIEDSEKDAERVNFGECFKIISDDEIQVKIALSVSEMKMLIGTIIRKGVAFGGIDFNLFRGRELSVIKEKNYWKIIGLYSE